MARARNLKPGFFKNEELAELEPLVRLLFAGLWTLADREGRLEDRPKRIRAELLPYDDGNIDEFLQCLHGAGFILRYVVDGNRFIQILKFSEHQNPHVKEPASSIPAPVKHGASTVQVHNENGSDRALTPLPITDSLNPIKSTSASPSGFAEFWNEYPKRVGKGDAERAWKKLKPDLPTVLKAIQAQRGSEQWLRDGGQYIPHPATWLNRKGWEDEVIPYDPNKFQTGGKSNAESRANVISEFTNKYRGQREPTLEGAIEGSYREVARD